MDPYRVLGVSETATDEEITAAYRRLARVYHPDLNGGSPEAEEKMKELNTAYDLIRDRRAGKETAGQGAEGNPYYRTGGFYGYGTGNPYGGSEKEGGGTYYTGYGPFGPFRVYRTSRPQRPRFSILRFLLTLLLLSALMRGCSLLSYYYTEFLPGYFERYEEPYEGTPTSAPPSYEKGPVI